jgi:4-hydroxybenzoyl-CoA thioesterase/acyl-CoA thioester hydrolase
MSAVFHYERRVEFRETDAAGIAHFSSFFAYMEEAEHALLRHLGCSVLTSDEHGSISFPRVSAQCDYQAAAYFEDVLDVAVTLTRLGSRSLTYRFVFHRGQEPIASGLMTGVCCRVDVDRPLRSIPLPETLAQQLAPFVEKPDSSPQ